MLAMDLHNLHNPLQVEMQTDQSGVTPMYYMTACGDFADLPQHGICMLPPPATA